MKPLHFISIFAASVLSLSSLRAVESVGLRSADLSSSRLITYPRLADHWTPGAF